VARLRVLGLEIEIRTTTEIGADDDHHDENEVRGLVASVDVDGGSITLEDGTVILVSDAGVFDNEGGDDEGEHLGGLDAVSQALTDGLTVTCEAEGAVQSADPLTLAAREVECEVRVDARSGPAYPHPARDDRRRGLGHEWVPLLTGPSRGGSP